MRFEIDSEFAEQFAALIRSAPIRLGVLERSIQHRIERALAVPADEELPVTVHLDDGYGLLIVETGLEGIPDLLVTFHYSAPSPDAVVDLLRVRAVEPPADEEDDSP